MRGDEAEVIAAAVAPKTWALTMRRARATMPPGPELMGVVRKASRRRGLR